MPPLSPSRWEKLRPHPYFYNDGITRSLHHPRLVSPSLLQERKHQRDALENAEYEARFGDGGRLSLSAFHFDPSNHGPLASYSGCHRSMYASRMTRWLVKRRLWRRTLYVFLLIATFFTLGALNWGGATKSSWTNRAPLMSFDFRQFNATIEQQNAHASIRLFATNSTLLSQRYHIYFTHWCSTATDVANNTQSTNGGMQPPAWPARDTVVCGERHLGAARIRDVWGIEGELEALSDTDPAAFNFFDAYSQFMGPIMRMMGLAIVSITGVLVFEILRFIARTWRTWLKRCFCSRQRRNRQPRDILDQDEAWTKRCYCCCGYRSCGFPKISMLLCYDPLSMQYRHYLREHLLFNPGLTSEQRYNIVKDLYVRYLRISVILRILQNLLLLITFACVLLSVVFTTVILITLPGIASEWERSGIRVSKAHPNTAMAGLGFAFVFLPFLLLLSVLNMQLERDELLDLIDDEGADARDWVYLIGLCLEPCCILACGCTMSSR